MTNNTFPKQLVTEKLGIIEYHENDVITFSEGLFGFKEEKQYLLIKNNDNNFFFFLQSIDEPSLMFILVTPKMVFVDYELDVQENDIPPLNIDHLVDFCIVTIPSSESEKNTVNLLGPIIIDVKQQLGKQVISLKEEYGTRHVLELDSEQDKEVTEETV